MQSAKKISPANEENTELKLVKDNPDPREQFSGTIRTITENVISTVSMLSESTRSLDEVRKDTNQLAGYSLNIASSAEELSATVNTIQQNLQNTIKAASETKNLASNGTTVIDRSVDRIKEVNDVLAQTNGSLKTLLTTVEQIDQIVKVITDISSRTDLLAINASIEAARAGKVGKGFAVVAAEVGRLAEKTQVSINDIQEIMKNIKGSVNEVSSRLSKCLDSAQESVTEATGAKNTFTKIVEMTGFVDREVTNIGVAVKDQSQAVDEIARSIGTVSKSSNHINSEIGKVADLTDKITKTSNGTRNELGKFDLGGKMLLEHAKIDHMFWMHRLRRMIDGKEPIRQEEFTDHTLCRLGKWYYSLKLDEFSEEFKEHYRQLEPPHAKLHGIAANLIRGYNEGHFKESLAMYEELIPISRSIIDKINQMIKAFGP